MNRTNATPAVDGQRIHDTMTLHRDVTAAKSNVTAAANTLAAIRAGNVPGIEPDAANDATFAGILRERQDRVAVLTRASAIFAESGASAAEAIERAEFEQAHNLLTADGEVA